MPAGSGKAYSPRLYTSRCVHCPLPLALILVAYALFTWLCCELIHANNTADAETRWPHIMQMLNRVSQRDYIADKEANSLRRKELYRTVIVTCARMGKLLASTQIKYLGDVTCPSHHTLAVQGTPFDRQQQEARKDNSEG